jgi:integrase
MADMADIERLIAQVADPYKPAVWLLAYTGLRPSELCGLRVASVDFVKRVIRVTETLMPVHRYADARYGLVGRPHKTQAGDRDIPIPGWLCDQLAAMLAARAEGQPGGIGRHDYLFVRQSGIPLHRDKFRQHVIRPG